MEKISEEKRMKKLHKVQNVRFEDQSLIVDVDGKTHRFRLSDISDRLRSASDAERRVFVISASGYGIRWPLLDEDLSVDGLLRAVSRPRKARGWAAGTKKSAPRF
jgi:chromosome condensin MukBEF ATPase and DNA-binding subunit MukB